MVDRARPIPGVVDAHVHCGLQNVGQPYEVIRRLLDEASMEAACLFDLLFAYWYGRLGAVITQER